MESSMTVLTLLGYGYPATDILLVNSMLQPFVSTRYCLGRLFTVNNSRLSCQCPAESGENLREQRSESEEWGLDGVEGSAESTHRGVLGTCGPERHGGELLVLTCPQ